MYFQSIKATRIICRCGQIVSHLVRFGKLQDRFKVTRGIVMPIVLQEVTITNFNAITTVSTSKVYNTNMKFPPTPSAKSKHYCGIAIRIRYPMVCIMVQWLVKPMSDGRFCRAILTADFVGRQKIGRFLYDTRSIKSADFIGDNFSSRTWF